MFIHEHMLQRLTFFSAHTANHMPLHNTIQYSCLILLKLKLIYILYYVYVYNYNPVGLVARVRVRPAVMLCIPTSSTNPSGCSRLYLLFSSMSIYGDAAIRQGQHTPTVNRPGLYSVHAAIFHCPSQLADSVHMNPWVWSLQHDFNLLSTNIPRYLKVSTYFMQGIVVVYIYSR